MKQKQIEQIVGEGVALFMDVVPTEVVKEIFEQLGEEVKAMEPLPTSAFEAIVKVLEEADGEPLSREEIAQRVQDQDGWSSGSETPVASIMRTVTEDIRLEGEQSVFERTSPGMFRLR